MHLIVLSPQAIECFPRYANKSIQKLKTKRIAKKWRRHIIIVKFACALAIKCKFVLEKFLSSDAAESHLARVLFLYDAQMMCNDKLINRGAFSVRFCISKAAVKFAFFAGHSQEASADGFALICDLFFHSQTRTMQSARAERRSIIKTPGMQIRRGMRGGWWIWAFFNKRGGVCAWAPTNKRMPPASPALVLSAWEPHETIKFQLKFETT